MIPDINGIVDFHPKLRTQDIPYTYTFDITGTYKVRDINISLVSNTEQHITGTIDVNITFACLDGQYMDNDNSALYIYTQFGGPVSAQLFNVPRIYHYVSGGLYPWTRNWIESIPFETIRNANTQNYTEADIILNSFTWFMRFQRGFTAEDYNFNWLEQQTRLSYADTVLPRPHYVPKVLPAVSADNITNSGGKAHGTLQYNGEDKVIEYGVVVSTTLTYPTYTSNDAYTWVDGSLNDGDPIVVDFPYLLPNTKYYYNLYAKNAVGYAYSSPGNFTTLKSKWATPPVPVASNITATSFILTSEPGATIVCNGQTKASGSTWTGLTAGNSYSAYAYIAASGPNLQSDNSISANITTLQLLAQSAPAAPVAFNIGSSSIILISDDGSIIVCNGQAKMSGSTWTGLISNTQYTAYAYMPSDSGHTQSPNSPSVNVVTKALPTVSVSVISNDTNGVIIGGEVLTDGGSTVTEVGLCISSTANPTYSNMVDRIIGGVINSFQFNMGRLAGGSFHARTYIKNSTDINYSNDLLVTVLKIDQNAPSIPTASNITSNSFTLTSNAGSTIVCNGQTKVSGSTWSGLVPGNAYDAYAYFAADAVYNISPNSNTVQIRTAKIAQSAPLNAPMVSSITATSMIWTTSSGQMIDCNGVQQPSGSTWLNLNPNTIYTATAFYPADATHDASPMGPSASASTFLPIYATPSTPTVVDISSRTVTLQSDPGTKIVCNGEEKDSGSTWAWLNPATGYTAYAYKPADANHGRSVNSTTKSFTTPITPGTEPAIAVSGVMSDGSQAPVDQIDGKLIITASNDNAIIRGNQILLVKRGTCRITYTVNGITTYTDITIV